MGLLTMKNYRVIFDITVGYTMDVDAENEQQARQIAREKMNNNMYYYAQHPTHAVGADIVDVEEEE